MQQVKFWLRITGAALLIHAALIILSVIEVVVYSLLIAPGRDQAFYEAHAAVSGPWISAIFGALIFFFVIRRYMKRFPGRHLAYVIGLLAVYHVIDLALLIAAGYTFGDFISPLVFAAIPKIAGSVLAYGLYRNMRR